MEDAYLDMFMEERMMGGPEWIDPYDDPFYDYDDEPEPDEDWEPEPREDFGWFGDEALCGE